jgi:hypothetical protein
MSRAIQAVNMNLLTGVVNHMAPAGQRMPELTAITLLEQSVCLLWVSFLISIDIYYCRIKSVACCAAMHHKCVLSLIIRKMVGFIVV